MRRAHNLYNVDLLTLQRRLNRMATRRIYEANLKKLTKLEEEVITKFIVNLGARGFLPTLATVRDMANTLLRKRCVEAARLSRLEASL